MIENILKFSDFINEEYVGVDINSLDDIDYIQMNKLSPIYKNRFKIMIEYDLLLPDLDEDLNDVARRVVLNDLKNLKNVEVTIDSIHKVNR